MTTDQCPVCKARLLPSFKHREGECVPRESEPVWQSWDAWLDALYFKRRDGRLIAVLDDGNEIEVL